MATFRIEGESLRLALTPAERLAGLHGDVTVPLSSVTSARATSDPFGELRGIRAPGTGWPRRIAIGIWRGRGFKDFAVLSGRGPAVVVELEGQAFARLLVSAAAPETVVARIDGRSPAA